MVETTPISVASLVFDQTLDRVSLRRQRWNFSKSKAARVRSKAHRKTETVILRFSAGPYGVSKSQSLVLKACYNDTTIYAYLALLMVSWNLQEIRSVSCFGRVATVLVPNTRLLRCSSRPFRTANFCIA